MPNIDTLPKVLRRNFEKFGDRKVAMRKKDYGVWKEYTWHDYYTRVKHFSLGLMSLGLVQGDKVSILGDSDPQWIWAEIAAQSAGAAVVGIYSDSLPTEVKYIATHSDSKVLVVQDQEQVDKVLSLKAELPLVKKVIYWDPKGMRNYDDPILLSFEQVLQLGRKYEKERPGLFEEMVEKGRGEDTALILYTSGTTGLPKGAITSHDNLLVWSSWHLSVNPSLDENTDVVCFLMPGWNAEQVSGLGAIMMLGGTQNFPESADTVQENIREIAPHYVLNASRVWEGVSSTIRAKIDDTSFLKRSFYNLFLPIGYKIADLYFDGKKPSLAWRAMYAVAHFMVFRPLRDKFGFSRIKVAQTGGAMLGPDIFRFFHAIGIRIKQGFGLTEIGFMSGHNDDNISPYTWGKPIPEAGIRISPDGEVLASKEACFIGYYKDAEATAKVFRGGVLHTGDSGYIDEEGNFIFIDRLSDLLELTDGTKFSPQFIESRLKFSPYVKEAITLGGKERPFVGAIINVDFQNVGNWAERKRIPYTTFADLSQKPQVHDLIKKDVERVNKHLPEKARVRRFALLHKEFDADEAELTRTRKLRRTFFEQRYKELVEAIYGDKDHLDVQAKVRYRDGREGSVTTCIGINTVT